MIRLDNITKEYRSGATVRALLSVTLTVERGECLAIMGPSGSGKSTLLNLVAGLDTPTSGSISFDGLKLSEMNDDDRTKLRRQKIGMVFQTFNLLPTLSALENVALPLRLQGSSRQDARRHAASMLERMALADRVAHLPDELSGGERQRVAIARALIGKPLVLLADEPIGNLDSTAGQHILDLLHQLHRETSLTIVLVTHNEAAAAGCDRIVTLRDGAIAREQVVNSQSNKR